MAPKQKPVAKRAPRRRISRKSKPEKRRGKSKKDVQKASTSNKKVGGKVSSGHAKNAYFIFSSHCRGEIVQEHGLDNRPEHWGEATRLLAQKWKELDASEKQKYEVCAAIEKQRHRLDSLRSKVRNEDGLLKIVAAVKDMFIALARAPMLSRANGMASHAIGTLEDLDQRMNTLSRAKVGMHFGARSISSDTVATLKHALGDALGDRLVSLLRRWIDTHSRVQAQGQLSSKQVSALASPQTSKKRKAAGEARAEASAEAAAEAKEDVDEVRGKVVGMLMRSFARASGRAEFSHCRQIEEALFALVGQDAKAYKRRARSIVFNLGAGDGALRRRVLDGTLQAHDLVRLDAEELASDVLKAERHAERERYFKSEVHDEKGPPKRKWELLGRTPVNEQHQQGSTPENKNLGEGDVYQSEATGISPIVVPLDLASVAAPICDSNGNHSDAAARSAEESQTSESDSDSSVDDSCELDNEPLADASIQLPMLPYADTSSDLKLAEILQESDSQSSSSSSSSSSQSEGSGLQQKREEERYSQLISMGFAASAAKRALSSTQGSAGQAVALLCGEKV